MGIGDSVLVRIEVPKGSRVKRDGSGGVDFVSPIGTPFNYGSVMGSSPGADGEPMDAVVLGPRLPRGERVHTTVRGVVDFIDAGKPDDKLICKGDNLTDRERWRIRAFFRVYAKVKTLARRIARGERPPTKFGGLRETPGLTRSARFVTDDGPGA